MQRGGFPIKTLILALFLIGTVYLLYLYNTTLGRLRDAELSAERYRREEETKVAQLQDVMRNKDELQEKWDNEKREFTNRLNSLNQQHKMLKSQYDEHEVEQMRLEQESRRLKEEFQQVETQRNQEYQHLKQEKELEISHLKDQLADAERQNEVLQGQITALKTQVQNEQNQVEYDQVLLRNQQAEITSLQQQLANKNAELQQQKLAGMQGFNNLQQAQQVQQGLHANVNLQQPQQGLHAMGMPQQQQQQQQLLNQQHFLQQGADVGQQGGVVNMDIQNQGMANMGVQHGQRAVNAGIMQAGFNDQQNQLQQQQLLDEHNQQHQMLPPANDADQQVMDAPAGGHVGGVQQEQMKDEDHQVKPPNLNVREEHRAGVEGHGGDDNGRMEDEHPLGLKQMAPPDIGGADGDGDVDGDVLHRLPPVNKQLGKVPAEEEEEEEEEDEEEHYDKYDDNNDANAGARNAARDFR